MITKELDAVIGKYLEYLACNNTFGKCVQKEFTKKLEK